MRFCRFFYMDKVRWGMLEDGRMQSLSAPPYYRVVKEGDPLPLEEVNLLAPAEPSKIVCLGLNYADHAREMGVDLPKEPVIFLKPPSSVVGPGDRIILPSVSRRVDYEAELAIIIGREAYEIPKERAFDYVFGYTCANDVTARDLQKKDGQWTRSKSFNTFCPLGPWIETELDPANLSIQLKKNGEIKQKSTTANLIFKVPEIVAFISSIMTLLPGDVILTGTPAGVGPVKPGDILEVSIEGIGILTNPVQGMKNVLAK
ncbi:fumarylacetoacetate hydrolase family protein [Thermosediminibacter litoriperuensis]|uniref:2-keto-4-pentenoate hydratase/2-oxohepta-3-ene-1,7-dioic acid hydratase in catechol pathway n=1 Tax=Thermosediminibacter litoriperuensis TaxID=291989 RepID=A0A5S5AV40_9FIRM|nr:fumarylacetoacetate hydrolase family protein [Thermosediminibacter litoriperuensis]TYP55483.1 2-keto-4-pentenoate hydratase/2-oxohepta-3-ene-1,7-dioic acid hydratase in catechol pathway [Thermosediminibacter litoriperuensis]